MSLGKNLQKVLYKLFRQIIKLTRVITKGLMNWLLRTFLVLGRKSRLSNAGFVLPTVVMVIMVVVLLTTAIVLRSFDRAKNASNVRVNEAVLQAATPALDRAKAKIYQLFQDPTLPRSTPTDLALYSVFTNNLSKYTFGDETPLKLVYDFGNGKGGSNKDGSIESLANTKADTLDNDETLNTAWRFPVDTDNNGKPDSYTLYGIFYRSPTASADRPRTPLEARTPPMVESVVNSQCKTGGGTSASLVGTTGWYKTGSSLKKSFFVFSATVPITSNPPQGAEIYKGNKGFSALEYQQDQARIPLTNNAVVYGDDLQVTAGSGIKLNGRIITNGNLLTAKGGGGDIEYYQVSGVQSCFYLEENGKITVGGNVLNDGISTNQGAVKVDLFQSGTQPTRVDFNGSSSSSVSNSGIEAAFNSQAYSNRINILVNKWIADKPAPVAGINAEDPKDVQEKVLKQGVDRSKALQDWFKDRTRLVPFKEDTSSDVSKAGYQGTGDELRPINEWMYPTDTQSGSSYNGLTLQPSQPPAVEPSMEQNQGETKLGDRIIVGNGLPAEWWDNTTKSFGDNINQLQQQVKPDTPWDQFNDPKKRLRYRTTQTAPLSDLGNTDRDGYWEQQAAFAPIQSLDGWGGLRVVTGAGVYSHIRDIPGATPTLQGSFLPFPLPPGPLSPTSYSTYDDPTTTVVEKFPVVWPDSMPMWYDTNGDNQVLTPIKFDGTAPAATDDRRGDLVMRATAVYHYASSSQDSQKPLPPNDGDQKQKPIACVSSYYDPSTSLTARNRSGLPDIRLRNTSSGRSISPGALSNVSTKPGNSHNGVSYTPKDTSANISGVTGPTNGLFPYTVGSGSEDPASNKTSLLQRIYYQANLVFPNGRFVNEKLRDALTRLANQKFLTLSEQAALDSTICAIEIADGTLSTPDDSVVPHGAIYETAFLDARQIKAVDPLIIAGQDDGNKRIYQMSSTGNLKVGDLVTIQGFVDDPNTNTVNEAKLNATNANIQLVTPTGISIPSSGTNIPQVSANAWVLTGKYDLSLEERQPQEIRATVLDLDLLRRKQVTVNAAANPQYPNPEFLLPDSGIIYATRDDALLDLSDPLPLDATDAQKASQKLASPVDFKLDPTRRPSGIMLINGSVLARGDAKPSNLFDLVKPAGAEKGLTLASNLPAYVQADKNLNGLKSGFNIHQTPSGNIVEEFKQQLASLQNWGQNDFYNRKDLEDQFACRQKDPRLPKCTEGDLWRSATVLADAVTLLSNDFRLGFRNEGDYDLRNNQEDPVKRKQNGFWNNNFVTNGLSSGSTFTLEDPAATTKNPVDADYRDAKTNNVVPSSYFNNFVTPIQRRENFPEYIMEICRKLPVSECTPSDWVVGYDIDNDGKFDKTEKDPAFGPAGQDFNGDGVADLNTKEQDVKADQLIKAVNISQGAPFNHPFAQQFLGAGTTALPAKVAADQRYARRVAFSREDTGQLKLSDRAAGANPAATTAIPWGIDSSSVPPVKRFEYNNNDVQPSVPSLAANKNALWFRTTSNLKGKPDSNAVADYSYDNDKSLYYQPPDEGLLLPKTPEIPGVTSLNIDNGSNNPISTFAVCLSGGEGVQNLPSFPTGAPPTLPNCSAAGTAITQAINEMKNLRTLPNFAGDEGQLIADKPVNVYKFNNTTNKINKSLELKGNRDSIFVFLTNNATRDLQFADGVNLKLTGVAPNNIFWVSQKGVDFLGANKIAGNFLGTGTITHASNAKILGGRFLGFNSISGTFDPSSAAMTSVDQPLLVPVLQTHLPTKGPGTNPNDTGEVVINKTNTLWLQRTQSDTTFNLVMAAGDSPTRGSVTGLPTAEYNGGLENFVRFLENWRKDDGTATPSRISGSFIQFKRSAYATAPARPIFATASFNTLSTPINSIFGFGNAAGGYPQLYRNTIGSPTGIGPGTSAYYVDPARNWGYDVGQLSQIPDLFSQRFTTPPAGEPNQFFREVGRDDLWVKTLLCGAAGQNTAANPNTYSYTTRAIDNTQLPSDCPSLSNYQ